jgi:2-oxoglutarate ferredoxin oxidoreductase subunit gamma
VTVILSDERISSPILNRFDTAILLNQQSMDKFEPTVKPGGVLLYDSNGITRHPSRTDIHIYQVDAAAESARMMTTKTFNMIVLGAYLKIKPLIGAESIVKAIKDSLPVRHHHLIPVNEDALKRGRDIVQQIS